ncbi:MAG: ABC transporter permease [Chloroflexi bacterium RBG_13_50_21]|nr:MAG: ABC transporter permease [Chloroflexi bacterium RBG_13_50_21]OGO59912.1 MAG: ABC transporter permease [Chloroflexi bacterium RBG_19FT_COMBO_47_9]
MKNTLKQVFHSGKFVAGFSIFMFIVVTVIIFPLFVKTDPLLTISQGSIQGSFLPPGIYVNVYDSIGVDPYTLLLDDAATKRIASKLGDQERLDLKEWLLKAGIPENEIDITDTKSLLGLWTNNYDPKKQVPGMTFAKTRYYQRLNSSLQGILSTEGLTIAATGTVTDTLQAGGTIAQTDYVNVREVPNVRLLLLGTDPFGRDVMTELVSATGTSLLIGIVAGLIATTIGLVLGLAAGYMGGMVDDVVMFFTNLFTVIPTIVLLILISYSIGQEKRGAVTIAVVIGFTAWVWTARAVRAQVISLRNRDHVNLSKLSGHPVWLIIFTDIFPYIASYVAMALILQISSAILYEASLSILGLGPKTTITATLGLMMNWAFYYMAPTLGKWWAYLPVIVVIALVSFSLNLMNTGLDQVYNPALRE